MRYMYNELMYVICNKNKRSNDKKAASLPHMDGSTVFARWRQCAPPPNTCFLGPPESIPKMASRPVQPSLHSSWQQSLYTLQWAVPFPSKLPPHTGISGPPSKTWFLGPTRVHAPNSTSINSVVFAGLKIMTDRQTDRQATLLCLQQ